MFMHKIKPTLKKGKIETRNCPTCDGWGPVYKYQAVYILVCVKCWNLHIRGFKKQKAVLCKCGNVLPQGRNKFCHNCVPKKRSTKAKVELLCWTTTGRVEFRLDGKTYTFLGLDSAVIHRIKDVAKKAPMRAFNMAKIHNRRKEK